MSAWSDLVLEARKTVDDAIDTLGAVPKNFGGHREADSTSTIDNTEREYVMHADGRVMRFDSFIDTANTPYDTPYLTAICVYRGRWVVVPAYKLRAIG